MSCDGRAVPASVSRRGQPRSQPSRRPPRSSHASSAPCAGAEEPPVLPAVLLCCGCAPCAFLRERRFWLCRSSLWSWLLNCTSCPCSARLSSSFAATICARRDGRKRGGAQRPREAHGAGSARRKRSGTPRPKPARAATQPPRPWRSKQPGGAAHRLEVAHVVGGRSVDLVHLLQQQPLLLEQRLVCEQRLPVLLDHGCLDL